MIRIRLFIDFFDEIFYVRMITSAGDGNWSSVKMSRASVISLSWIWIGPQGQINCQLPYMRSSLFDEAYITIRIPAQSFFIVQQFLSHWLSSLHGVLSRKGRSRSEHDSLQKYKLLWPFRQNNKTKTCDKYVRTHSLCCKYKIIQMTALPHFQYLNAGLLTKE